jgi:uncharacterized phage protein (TIGR02218 family)
VGATTVIRTTDYEETLAYDGEDWVPYACEHGEIRQTIRMDRDAFTVRMRYRADLLSVCLPGRNDAVLRLVIRRVEVDGTDGINPETVFTGTLAQSAASGPWVTLTFGGPAALFDAPVPRRLMQRTCNFAVYDARCGVDTDPLWISGTVTDVDPDEPDRIFTDSGYTPGAQLPKPGLLEWLTGGNAERYIEVDEYDSGEFKLLMPLAQDIEVGDEFRVRPDCAKRFIEDCRDKWSNVPNFRGEPGLRPGDSGQSSVPGARINPVAGTGSVIVE